MKKGKKRNLHVHHRVLQHRLSIFLISCVVVTLGICLSVKVISKQRKNQALKVQEAELVEQMKVEKSRAEENDELEDYVGTEQYIKDVAKDKLGLVYPNEIRFEAE